jgi:hypothetical protein
MRLSIRLLICGALLATLAGCVSTPALTYQPSIDNTERLLSARDKLDVGRFDAAAGVENRRLGMRGSSLNGGADGTFATYLKDALATELREAGRFQPMAATVVSGRLVENRMSAAGASQGKATLAADFVVTRGGEQVYTRTIRIENTWESSFIGAIAIPAAITGYSASVQKLLGELFADPEFRRATQAGAIAN